VENGDLRVLIFIGDNPEIILGRKLLEKCTLFIMMKLIICAHYLMENSSLK
jgi:hypothetical protein